MKYHLERKCFAYLFALLILALPVSAFYLEPDSGGSVWQLLLWIAAIILAFVIVSAVFALISAFLARYVGQPIKRLFKK